MGARFAAVSASEYSRGNSSIFRQGLWPQGSIQYASSSRHHKDHSIRLLASKSRCKAFIMWSVSSSTRHGKVVCMVSLLFATTDPGPRIGLRVCIRTLVGESFLRSSMSSRAGQFSIMSQSRRLIQLSGFPPGLVPFSSSQFLLSQTAERISLLVTTFSVHMALLLLLRPTQSARSCWLMLLRQHWCAAGSATRSARRWLLIPDV